MLKVVFTIKRDHPSLPGHFPGNPVTPGVVVLDNVCEGLLQKYPGIKITGFPWVKFKKPVMPGMPVEVTYLRKSETLINFECATHDAILLAGQIKVQEGDAQ